MVVLVKTVGTGSMDFYSEKLAERYKGPQLTTDVYQRIAEAFTTPLVSWRAVKYAIEERQFISKLNTLPATYHLPNHHLGRYGAFLKRPYTITVHDLGRQFDALGIGPTNIHKPNLRDKIYLGLDRKGIRKANLVISISQYTANHIMEYLNVPEERIRVVYEGVDHELFHPRQKLRVANKYLPPNPLGNTPYILYVGSEHARKNLPTLLRAFALLKKDAKFRNLKLVKVGSPGGRAEDAALKFHAPIARLAKELGIEDDITWTGRVPEHELPSLYSHAECFILPSTFEGFGLTVLEAMACGSPTIVANATSLPEIGGEAAIVVEPFDVQAYAREISSIVTNVKRRDRLVESSIKWANKFSWDTTLNETLKVYAELEKLAID